MVDNGLILTIFGGTGNLTYNKLIPAFYQLYKEGRITDNVSIVAVGRRDKTSESYRKEFREVLEKKIKDFDPEVYDRFNILIHYFKMDFGAPDDYESFYNYMNQTDADHNGSGNRIFYLATSPSAFPFISEQLKSHGLLDTGGFTRAVFEKPFGYNLESAIDINETVSKIFGEDNIYRIDHYLGKEMIQNINLVRFSNQIFSAVWNKDSIDNIQITVKESVGVEERGGYYDTSGALRDMVQNHLMQILALVAMEPPARFDTDSIRDEKVRVIKNIKVNKNLADRELIFGQYAGYKGEVKVDPESSTETFVAMKVEVDSSRWEGVPFYLRTGKALDGREAEVIIEFKVDTCCSEFDASAKPNLLIIKIQPEEGIYFRINTKEPRSESKLMTVSMDYCQSCNIYYRSPEAYERLLLDIMNGDATLFTRWDEVYSAWQLVSEFTEKTKDKSTYMTSYEIGSAGPEEAHEMLEKDGRKWWLLDDLQSDFMLG